MINSSRRMAANYYIYDDIKPFLGTTIKKRLKTCTSSKRSHKHQSSLHYHVSSYTDRTRRWQRIDVMSSRRFADKTNYIFVLWQTHIDIVIKSHANFFVLWPSLIDDDDVCVVSSFLLVASLMAQKNFRILVSIFKHEMWVRS